MVMTVLSSISFSKASCTKNSLSASNALDRIKRHAVNWHSRIHIQYNEYVICVWLVHKDSLI